jgi:hypothetical protein
MNSTISPRTHKSDDTLRGGHIPARNRQVRDTLCCPHCGGKLTKWQVPDSPFNEWPSEFQYICFNDSCVYFARGWYTMAAQGGFGSYRFMYDPPTHGCHPVPVLSRSALRDGIVRHNG